MTTVLANGLSHHVQRMPASTGNASITVVCIHGILTDSLASYYFTLAKPLADAGADVFMYDLRGHGRSERPPTGYGLDEFVADLSALLDEVGISGPVYLVGNSFGGTVAFSFAARYPDRVAGIAMIESEPATAAWAEKMTANLGRAAKQLGRWDSLVWIRTHYGAHTVRLARAALKLLNASSIERDIPASPTLSPEQVRSITCPVLAIYGSKSDLAEQAPLLRDEMSNCTTLVIPGQEHSVLIEVPDTVRDTVLTWLGGREPAGVR